MSLTNIPRRPDIPLFALDGVLQKLRADPAGQIDAKTFGQLFACNQRRAGRMLAELTGCKAAESVDRAKLITVLEGLAADTLSRLARKK